MMVLNVLFFNYWSNMKLIKRQHPIFSKLIIILAVIGFSVVINLGMTYEMTKVTRLTQLNFNHMKYVDELITVVQDFAFDENYETHEIEATLNRVQQQPADCLSELGGLEQLILQYSGASRIIQLCEDDLTLVNKTQDQLHQYQNGKFTKVKLTQKLQDAKRQFLKNSDDIQPLIYQTSQRMIQFIQFFSILKALFVLLLVGFILREIAKHYKQLERVQHSLSESEDRYQLVTKNTRIGIWDRNVITNEQFFSDQYKAILLYQPHEFVNHYQSFEAHLHPNDKERVLRAVENHFRKKVPYDIEYRLKQKSGNYIWVHDRGQAVWDENDQPIRFVGSLEDVSQPRLFKQLVQKEKEFSLNIIQKCSALIVGIAPNGMTKFMNPKAVQVTGYEPRDMIGKNWWKILYPGDDFQQVTEVIKTMETGDVKDYEMMLTCKNGEKRIVSWNSLNLTGKNGDVMEYIGFGIDVTELRKNEKELAELFNGVPALIWYKDKHNNMLRLNQPAAETMGVSIEEATGKNTKDFFPDLADEYFQDDLEVIQTGKPKLGIIEPYLPEPDTDQARWVRTDKVTYRDPDGNTLGVIVMAIDITKQRLAEEGLRESEKRYNLATEGSGAGIWDWNIVENTMYWSPVFLKMLHINTIEYGPTYEDFLSMVHTDDRQDVMDAVNKHLMG